MAQQHCPICSAEVTPNSRYPHYVCSVCRAKAVTANGRPLTFSTVDFSGGFVARYADTGEIDPSHECFIAGIKCYTNEARLGGIVLEVVA
jgi:hypothetical protein